MSDTGTAETTDIFFFTDPLSGAVTRLTKWPEGLVLWHCGEIVWRAWAPDGQEHPGRAPWMLGDALRQAISIIEKNVPEDALGQVDRGPEVAPYPLLAEYLHYFKDALRQAGQLKPSEDIPEMDPSALLREVVARQNAQTDARALRSMLAAMLGRIYARDWRGLERDAEHAAHLVAYPSAHEDRWPGES